MTHVTYVVKYWWLSGNTGYNTYTVYEEALKAFKNFVGHRAVKRVQFRQETTSSTTIWDRKLKR